MHMYIYICIHTYICTHNTHTPIHTKTHAHHIKILQTDVAPGPTMTTRLWTTSCRTTPKCSACCNPPVEPFHKWLWLICDWSLQMRYFPQMNRKRAAANGPPNDKFPASPLNPAKQNEACGCVLSRMWMRHVTHVSHVTPHYVRRNCSRTSTRLPVDPLNSMNETVPANKSQSSDLQDHSETLSCCVTLSFWFLEMLMPATTLYINMYICIYVYMYICIYVFIFNTRPSLVHVTLTPKRHSQKCFWGRGFEEQIEQSLKSDSVYPKDVVETSLNMARLVFVEFGERARAQGEGKEQAHCGTPAITDE